MEKGTRYKVQGTRKAQGTRCKTKTWFYKIEKDTISTLQV